MLEPSLDDRRWSRTVTQTSPPDRTPPDRSQCSSIEGREDDSDPARTATRSALQWGTPDLIVFAIAKYALRGWIRALEWVIGSHGRRGRQPAAGGCRINLKGVRRLPPLGASLWSQIRSFWRLSS